MELGKRGRQRELGPWPSFGSFCNIPSASLLRQAFAFIPIQYNTCHDCDGSEQEDVALTDPAKLRSRVSDLLSDLVATRVL